MGLGILEDHKLRHVPGTEVILEDSRRQPDEQRIDPSLKYDRNGAYPILLVPQPSDDPNDPLNLPLWRRDLILLIICLLAVLASTLSSLMAANTLTLSLHFARTFTSVALLTGYHLLGVAVSGLLYVPSARIWGKRHAYLLGTIFIIFSSAWGGAVGKNYASLLWARIFQGVGLAPFEALVNASVGDLYFVHESGKRMAFSNLALFGGAFLTPVVVGKMTHTLGWEWSFWFVAAFAGAMLPLLVFFVPETAFRRDKQAVAANGRLGSAGMDEAHELVDTPQAEKGFAAGEDKALEAGAHRQTSTPQGRVPYRKTLLPFNGRKTDETFWKLFLRPFPLFFHPHIFWAMLIQGTLIGWTVMIGIVLAAIMLGPPLFFDEVHTGYMYTGAFVGAIIGFVLSGLTADWSAKAMTKANRGVFEPEFRMVLVVLQLVLGCAGLYGFGITANATSRYGWFWPDFFFALVVAGMVCGAVASALYVVDAHRNVAIEAFTCLLFFKNIFSFGLTWSAYDWLVKNGIKRPFMGVASVQVVVCLSTVVMYIFGKRNRSFWARHDVLKMLGLW